MLTILVIHDHADCDPLESNSRPVKFPDPKPYTLTHCERRSPYIVRLQELANAFGDLCGAFGVGIGP